MNNKYCMVKGFQFIIIIIIVVINVKNVSQHKDFKVFIIPTMLSSLDNNFRC